MALNENTLYTEIKEYVTSALNSVTMSADDGETINIFDSSSVQSKYGNDPKFMNYNGTQYTGIGVIVEILSDKIAEKVVEHLTENIKTSLLERFELLEIDFDNFVNAMLTVGVGAATAVPAVVTTYKAASNTNVRSTNKTTALSEGSPIIYGRK